MMPEPESYARREKTREIPSGRLSIGSTSYGRYPGLYTKLLKFLPKKRKGEKIVIHVWGIGGWGKTGRFAPMIQEAIEMMKKGGYQNYEIYAMDVDWKLVKELGKRFKHNKRVIPIHADIQGKYPEIPRGDIVSIISVLPYLSLGKKERELEPHLQDSQLNVNYPDRPIVRLPEKFRIGILNKIVKRAVKKGSIVVFDGADVQTLSIGLRERLSDPIIEWIMNAVDAGDFEFKKQGDYLSKKFSFPHPDFKLLDVAAERPLPSPPPKKIGDITVYPPRESRVDSIAMIYRYKPGFGFRRFAS
jgi:hypothetical protein